MPLIAPKVFNKHLNPQPVPADHLEALQAWKDRIKSGDLKKQNEKSLHASFTLQVLVKLLGYRVFGEMDHYTVAREYRIAKGEVDLALGCFSNDKSKDQVKAVFEAKGAKTTNLDAIMPGRHKSPIQQAWEYARDVKGVEWVLVTNYLEIRLYHIGETSLVYEQFDLARLDDPWEYARFQLCLHADNLLTGRTLELLQQTHQVGKEITERLYDDYKSLRETLIVSLIEANPNFSPVDLVAPAQKLLDRLLFVAFAEDSGLIPESTIAQAYQHADPYNPRPVYENFKGLFRAIDQGNSQLNIPAYNGGLFAEDTLLDELKVSDSLCEAFKELADYDFASEVSVTVLGHIFEQSIADLEELTEQLQQGAELKRKDKARSVSGKRKLQGVVYTPDTITAFIVEQTLGQYLQKRFENLLGNYGQVKKDGSIQWKKGKQMELKFWYAWQEALQSIRVVDPACGSGAFLVAAFDYLHSEYQRINDKLAELTGHPGVFDLNKEILNRNLYGVDINSESIEISRLSLWLKTAERGKPLTSLEACIRQGNSLGFSEAATSEGFCWQQAFPDIFAEGGFDVVLGNPPYVRQERFSDLKPWLAEHYRVYHGVVDLYAYFFELGLKLLKPGGLLGYISSATFFKTGSGKPLRQYLAEQASFSKVVDFGDLQVFEGVTTYPAILILENTQPQPGQRLHMLSLKDQLPDNLNQFFSQHQGQMPQSQLQESGWQLEDESLAALRYKLTHDAQGQPYPTIKEVYGSPLYGVKTGCNEAFVIDQTTRDALVAEDPNSAEVLKPFLEGKDLKKWYAQGRNLWLIALPKFWTRQQLQLAKEASLSEDTAWDYLSSHYSAVARHLLPFAEKARKRGDKGEFWWELRACAYYDKFALPKVFYPDITDSPKFHLDTTGAFSSNTAYFYPHGNTYLVGLLNSKAVWYFLTGIADSVRGGFYRMFSQNLNRIPLPPAADDQQEKIASLAQQCQQLAEQRQQQRQRFTRRLTDDLCPADQEPKLNTKSLNWWLLDFKTLQSELKKSFKLKAKDTLMPVAERNDWQDYFENEKGKISQLDQQLIETEVKLNQEVNGLFGLTESEISLLG
jgi:type I restriction-modification system DNA methylase subunit